MSGAAAQGKTAVPPVGGFGQAVKHIADRGLGLAVLPLCRVVALILSTLSTNVAHGVFYQRGFHLLRKHYYVPIPEEEDLGAAYLQRESQLVGMQLNEESALRLMDDVFPPWLEEFGRTFALHGPAAPGAFFLINGTFMAIDAHVYYCLIRHFKPGRIIEIGAGASTLLAAAACRRNVEEGGAATDFTAIEPFPGDFLKEVPGLTRLVRDRVQNVDMGLFTSLGPGDMLFIDSSHVLRTGGDVQFEYCEVLPRLSPGVLVHVHDISLPKPYPRVYFDRQLYWNEEYLLQAMLSFTSRYEVVWPGSCLMVKHPQRMARAFPGYAEMCREFPQAEPTSFWFRVRS